MGLSGSCWVSGGGDVTFEFGAVVDWAGGRMVVSDVAGDMCGIVFVIVWEGFYCAVVFVD